MKTVLNFITKFEQMLTLQDAHIVALKTQIEQMGHIEIHNHLPPPAVGDSPPPLPPSAQLPAPAPAVARSESLCLFVHPAIGEPQAWQIHDEIKRLVCRQRIQDICQYLQQMRAENRILLPISPQTAYTELVRMGMPEGEGYSPKSFQKYYKR